MARLSVADSTSDQPQGLLEILQSLPPPDLEKPRHSPRLRPVRQSPLALLLHLAMARTQSLTVSAPEALWASGNERSDSVAIPYGGGMIELKDHLARVEDVAARARDFQANEASDPKAFSRAVVEDLGVLAKAVAELIKRSAI